MRGEKISPLLPSTGEVSVGEMGSLWAYEGNGQSGKVLRAIKNTISLKKLTLEGNLYELDLFSLEKRGLGRNMITVLKYVKGSCSLTGSKCCPC